MRRTKGRYATVKRVPVILDLGHYALKGIVGDDAARRVWLPHALLNISADEWLSVVQAGNNSNPDYIQVNGDFYEVGDTARNHTFRIVEGIDRYTKQHYGVLMCQVIARLFEPDEINGAVVFASYPPGDRRHTDELEQTLLGAWDFVHLGREYHVVVEQVVTYTEPLGGFWNFVIQEDENGHFDNDEYHSNRLTLVADFGGGTFSLLTVGRDQMPDFRRADSFDIGFNDVANLFMRELRANHRDLFRSSRTLPQHELHEALRTGKFYGGGYVDGLPVQTEINTAMAELVEQFRMAYQGVGGGGQFGQIVLTGGGSAVLGERLKELMGHPRVFYAHNDLEQIAYANVSGGFKAYQEMQMAGAIS
jgi:hypothetical protein